MYSGAVARKLVKTLFNVCGVCHDTVSINRYLYIGSCGSDGAVLQGL